MRKLPTLDIAHCTMCMSCTEVCPEIFVENPYGYIEVLESYPYPENKIGEAIKYCPHDCIKESDV